MAFVCQLEYLKHVGVSLIILKVTIVMSVFIQYHININHNTNWIMVKPFKEVGKEVNHIWQHSPDKKED